MPKATRAMTRRTTRDPAPASVAAPAPPFTVGILGGGQLARMTADAARTLGVPTIVIDPEPESPAGQVTRQIVGPLADGAALIELAREIDVATLENEFVDLSALRTLAARGVMVRPPIHTFEIVQDKLRQKQRMAEAGLSLSAVAGIDSPDQVAGFAEAHGWPVVLKTRSQGYDGRGVAIAGEPGGVDAAWRRLGAGVRPLMAESFVEFATEIAVMVVRGARGEVAAYPVVETVQRGYVCHLVRAPAALPSHVAARARDVAVRAVAAIEGIGVHGVELFLDAGGRVGVNEIAPRPHNSGHYTIDACVCSQFENHLRAILGLPLGATEMTAPAAVMVNLLGTRNGTAPEGVVRREGEAAVHLYGKHEIRPGRKMGHVTATGPSIAAAESSATAAAAALDL
jgi:5-(carboxyamino)imidazole ribonucleotide synthase